MAKYGPQFASAYEGPNRLWHHCEALAKPLRGDKVVAALARASEQVYWAGVDEAYQGLTQTPANVASFDAGWLTVFAVELTKERA